MTEIWRDIKDYEGLYQISNLGRVRSLDRYAKHSRGGNMLIKGKILKPTINSNDYYVVNLSKNGVEIINYIHRLVAEAFVLNPENKPEVDHINTNRTDNRIENLRWATDEEQANNSLTKEHNSNAKKGKYGKEHPRSKPVLQFDLNGNFIKEWECATQVEKELGISHCHICQCCQNKRKSAGGYIWKYKD